MIKNIIKTYNHLEKILKYGTSKYNKIYEQVNINYKNFFVPKFYSTIFNKNSFDKDINTDNKIYNITKLFESSHLSLNKNILEYKTLQIFKNKYKSLFVFVNFYSSIKDRKNITTKYKYDINLYNKGLISFPLTFNDIENINNYVYYIYKFIYSNTLNTYKASVLALFYYFIGFFLAVFSLYFDNNIKILYSNLIIISTKLSNFIMIESSNDINVFIKYIDNIKIINIVNNSLFLSDKSILIYIPYLIGITIYTGVNQGILAKLSFQNTLKTLQSLILNEKLDWKVDTKSNLILSNFTPVGSGWYRYFTN